MTAELFIKSFQKKHAKYDIVKYFVLEITNGMISYNRKITNGFLLVIIVLMHLTNIMC
jgi:hypothetical protein